MLKRIGLVAVAAFLALAALVTGERSIYFVVYLMAAVIAAAYLVARRGLVDLQAGAWLERSHASAGDVLTITYALRNTSRLPKPWLEVHSPSTLPVAVPGRVLSLAPRTARSWAARVPLTERGQFRVDPIVVRTGDPLGLFESVASVGAGSGLLVYPRVEALPAWRIPHASMEGSASRHRRGPHATPLVTSVRPYTPGDAFNRIHWRSSARHQELQVKEFDVEEAADVWIFLDLDRARHSGSGAHATIETAVRAVASITEHALAAGRQVGLEAVGLRRAHIPADRGQRQRHKVMSLLAVAQADGAVSLPELLAQSGRRLRRGMVAVVVTPSLDQTWLRLVADLRAKGAPVAVCLVEPAAPERVDQPADPSTESPAGSDAMHREMRALRHALLEHDVETHVLSPRVPLGEQIVSARETVRAVPTW